MNENVHNLFFSGDATAHLACYERSNDDADFYHAVDRLQEALHVCLQGRFQHHLDLFALSLAYRKRSRKARVVHLLDEVVFYQRAKFKYTPDGHHDRVQASSLLIQDTPMKMLEQVCVFCAKPQGTFIMLHPMPNQVNGGFR